MPAYAFPAEAGTHLPTPGGWKAELALEPDLSNHCTTKHISHIDLFAVASKHSQRMIQQIRL